MKKGNEERKNELVQQIVNSMVELTELGHTSALGTAFEAGLDKAFMSDYARADIWDYLRNGIGKKYDYLTSGGKN